MRDYEAYEVAKWFIHNLPEETTKTSLKIQKLLYFAEAWVNVLLDKNLFKEDIEAWAHGPVVRKVHNALQRVVSNKDEDIDCTKISNVKQNFSKDVEEVLNSVIETYGEFSGLVLEDMTHQDAPWKSARIGLNPEEKSNKIIPKKEIKEYFKKKYAEVL